VGQPSDLSHFQAHAYRWQEKHLCNSGGDARFFFIQQNNHFRTGGRVRRLSRPQLRFQETVARANQVPSHPGDGVASHLLAAIREVFHGRDAA